MRHRLAALRALHPYPSVLVAAVTVAIVPIADAESPASRYLVLGGAMLLMQFTVGLVNDVVDLPDDRDTKPWKPLVRGAMSRRSALLVAGLFGAGALAAMSTLPARAFAIGLAGFACGLAYDLYLKRTRLSWAPLSVALPLVPAWVFAAADRLRAELWWTVPLGLLLGAALNLANEAPDARPQGQSGIADHLGARRSRIAALSLFAATTVLLAIVAGSRSPARGTAALILGAATVTAAPWSTRLLGRDGLFEVLGAGAGALALLLLTSL